MNTNTNLSFLQAHSFPFVKQQTSSRVTVSESFDNPSTHNDVAHNSDNGSENKHKNRHQKQIKEAKQCCKRFFTFLFSHIGLSAVLVGYVIFGGFLFLNLEKSNELRVKNVVMKNRSKFIENIVKDLERYGFLIKVQNRTILDVGKTKVVIINNGTTFLENYLTEKMSVYTKHIIDFIQDKGWNGNDDSGNLNWSYEGSLLYVITVITTIGYGHVAPKTPFGKFLTMLYALIGIPLTFLYLSNVGDYLADWFRFIYHKICRKLCNYCCQRTIKKPNAFRSRLQRVNAFPGLQNKTKLPNQSKQTITSNNILNQPLKQFRDRWKKLIHKADNKPEDNRDKLEVDTSDIRSREKVEQFACKSYGIARFLPSIQTVKQRDTMLMNCVSTNVPVINWRDIDTDLELGSLDNIHTITNIEITPEICYTIDEPTTNKSLPTRDESLVTINPEVMSLNGPCNLSKLKTNPLYQSLPYLSNLSDLSTKNDSVKRRRSSFVADINFMSESIRQVSYLSVNNIVDRDTDLRNHPRKVVNIQAATVPISLSFAVICIYIIFGSIIFTIWEDNDYLKWSYFCFITLSTIGFGDIVPGTKIDSENPKEKLILVSIYVIIGLSVFAMCFKLMQEEVVAKFKRFIKKLEALKYRLLRINKKQKKDQESIGPMPEL